MIEREYRAMARLEHEFWWYRGSEKIFESMLAGRLDGKKLILNAGCGTGRLTDFLEKKHSVVGIDLSEKALAYCGRKGHKNLALADVSSMPVKNKFDLVLATDVLYHKNVKTVKTVKEFRRVLKKGGLLLLNEPAFEFLRSSHDVAMHTKKRFTKSELTELLEKNGFRVLKASYWNFFPFPGIAIMRYLKRNSPAEKSDIRRISPALNSLLYALILVESKLIRVLNLPFGVSVCCLAEKVKE